MKSKSEVKKTIYLKLLTIALTMVALSGVFIYFQTILVFELVADSELAYNGVKKSFVKTFDTFEKNNCLNGEPCTCVLLVHGLGDTAYTWQKTLVSDSQRFKKPVHLFAVNLPGSLQTPKLKSDDLYKPHRLAEILADTYLPLCEKWVLVGNSYGGWLSTIMAIQHPEKISSMVLTAPAGLKKDYSHILNYFLKPTVEEAKFFYKKTYFETQALPDFVFLRIVERARTLPIVTMLKSVADDDYLDSVLEKNKIPTRLIWGDHDNVILTSWGEEFHSKMNNSTLRIAEKCGHIPQKECFDIFLQELNLALENNSI